MALSNKWENICRLCSEEKNDMLSIFGNEGMERKVVQKLRACLPVLVYKTDPLPKQICQFCAARLDDAYEFREYCLSVYKSMHQKLVAFKDTEPVQIFLDAMRNSPDPCQAQLWSEKVRAPPPLVPLPSALLIETPLTQIKDQPENHMNNCVEVLSELPCEVEIEEMNAERSPDKNIPLCKPMDIKDMNSCGANTITDNGMTLLQNLCDKDQALEDGCINKEEKKTSILEQVLTGSLTMNDRKDVKGKSRLSSKWWCAPCNCYYKSKEILMEHIQSHCPRKYTCKKCSISFDSVKQLAKHEAIDHMRVAVGFGVDVYECHECDRQFVSWGMLKQHRLRDHSAKDLETGTNTWCLLCNRYFSSIEAFQSHSQLHSVASRTDDNVLSPTHSVVDTVPRTQETAREVKKEYSSDNVKPLTCPTCGKVCTQQSALSNHMRTHEPKRHKCDICGRSFGLFIRLAAHRLNEHSEEVAMSPLMASVEQEEALNAEREAREARNRLARSRMYSETERDGTTTNDEPLAKRMNVQGGSTLKNVARCGICLEWFNDHTTMLTHLQTHSDTYSCKNFTCDICKKSFKEKRQLLRHEVVHKRNETASRYTCRACNKTYVDKSAYRAHQKLHTAEKSSLVYHCSKCNKVFPKEVSLLTHQCTTQTLSKKGILSRTPQRYSTMGNVKKFKCPKCNGSFSTPQAKSNHMRTHVEKAHARTGKQKNTVKANDKAMPTLRPEPSKDLTVLAVEPKVEVKEETAPAPIKRTLIRSAGGYRCGVCQSPFVLRELAVAHLRSAHPVMPYQCPYCKKRFTTQYMFTHHIKTDHPKVPEN